MRLFLPCGPAALPPGWHAGERRFRVYEGIIHPRNGRSFTTKNTKSTEKEVYGWYERSPFGWKSFFSNSFSLFVFYVFFVVKSRF